VDTGAHRELKVLEAIAEDEKMTQRGLAARLGIALGLTNLYLKRLVRKGYVKCVNVQSNRVLYLITPKGIAEKSRLAYEFMEYSLLVYREGRKHLKSVLQPYAEHPLTRIAIYGTGDAAELAYLCLKELGLEPVVVFETDRTGAFLGIPLLDIRSHHTVDYDLMVVATIVRAEEILESLVESGVPRAKMITLRPNGGAFGDGPAQS
jgi:DNA-binding MarR family transcriptional regulator